MALTPVSKDAFATLAFCEESKKTFGITIEPNGNILKFIWSFKIDKEKAHREHFDAHKVRGSIQLDDNFLGCPYCRAKIFYICGNCGSIACYHGQSHVTCPSCGASGEIHSVDSVELKGGGY